MVRVALGFELARTRQPVALAERAGVKTAQHASAKDVGNVGPAIGHASYVGPVSPVLRRSVTTTTAQS